MEETNLTLEKRVRRFIKNRDDLFEKVIELAVAEGMEERIIHSYLDDIACGTATRLAVMEAILSHVERWQSGALPMTVEVEDVRPGYIRFFNIGSVEMVEKWAESLDDPTSVVSNSGQQGVEVCPGLYNVCLGPDIFCLFAWNGTTLIDALAKHVIFLLDGKALERFLSAYPNSTESGWCEPGES